MIMTGLGICGAALLYGDGMITPAILVFSAVEGLALLSPAFTHMAVPLTVLILIALFAIQRKGSGSGPGFGTGDAALVCCACGPGRSAGRQHPQILSPFNPLAWLRYLTGHGGSAMVVLGSVFLAVTGGEALYADLGHFGRAPIRMAWNCLVLPALALNYLGQGALVLGQPEAAQNPFFLLAPGWALVPMVILATAATVIASQALICGVFSLTAQAMQMGYLPRLRLLHTNQEAAGQIYLPQVNLALAAACVALVLVFRSSSALASAYGVAVTLTMLTTTLLFYFAAQRLWGWGALKAGLVCGLFGTIEMAFFASNALKILHGGWLPLCLGALLFYLMTTWKMGREVVMEQQGEASLPLSEFAAATSESAAPGKAPTVVRVKGTAVFLTGLTTGTPGALVRNLQHNHVLHERNIILTFVTDPSPRCEDKDRISLDELRNGFYRVTAHFGFMENPTIQVILDATRENGFPIALEDTSFFLSGQNLLATPGKGLARWREGAFAFMSRNAEKASEFLGMPADRTIEITWPVEI